MNLYEKIWLISWVLSIPFMCVFCILKDEYDFFLWDFLFVINMIILLSIPIFMIIGLPIFVILTL